MARKKSEAMKTEEPPKITPRPDDEPSPDRMIRVRPDTQVYRSWEADLATRLEREVGPCMIHVRPIGFDVHTSLDTKREELGSKRYKVWERIVSESRMHQRVPKLLEAGFTADEIQQLGLANIALGKERYYGAYQSRAEYESDRNRLESAERDFKALPAWIRARFQNSVGVLVEFMTDVRNGEHAMALGLERDVERYLQSNDRFDPSRGHGNLADILERHAANAAELELSAAVDRAVAASGLPNTTEWREAERKRELKRRAEAAERIRENMRRDSDPVAP